MAACLGAALLFLLEPMAGRALLPAFGGAPQVWAVGLVFFQAALLVGYGYAHISTRWLGLRRQPLLHLGLLLLPFLTLPVALPSFAAPPAAAPPAAWLLLVLVVMVGAPYTVVTTASPVLLRWFAATDHRAAGDPYFLYAMSNAGSLLALLGFPLLLEPNLTLGRQSGAWALGYGALALLISARAFRWEPKR